MSLSLGRFKIIEALIRLEQIVYNSPARARARSCLRAATPTSLLRELIFWSLCPPHPPSRVPLSPLLQVHGVGWDREAPAQVFQQDAPHLQQYVLHRPYGPVKTSKHQRSRSFNVKANVSLSSWKKQNNSMRCKKMSNTSLCTLTWTSWFAF